MRPHTNPARHLLVLIAVLVPSWAVADPADDVPWALADRHTLLVVQVDLERLTVEDLGASLRAIAGEGGDESWIGQALGWLDQLKGAGAERIALSLGAPFDEVGEDQEAPMWAAVRHKPADAASVRQVIEQIGRDAGVPIAFGASQDRWTAWWVAGHPPQPPLAVDRVAQVRLALTEARGGAVTAALVLPPTTRDWLAQRFGEFGELTQGPASNALRRASDATRRLRYVTAGAWLGPSPRVRVEFVFGEPIGADELTRSVEHLRDYFAQSLSNLPADSPKRPQFDARYQICRVRSADRQVVWELEPERMHLLRQLLLTPDTPATGDKDENK